MNQDLAFAKELAKYKDQWVALRTSVVASGKSVREVQEKAARKKITDSPSTTSLQSGSPWWYEIPLYTPFPRGFRIGRT